MLGPAGDSGQEAAALKKLLESGAGYVGKGEFDKARECYQNVADRYPEDYRGWWGMIICSTKNLQMIAQEQTWLNAWFKRAQAQSDGPEHNEMKARYVRYLRLLAQADVEEEIRLP